MQFQDVIDKRRTVRDFSPRPIAYPIIEKAIANGFKAPTYNHLREWHFIVVEENTVKLKLTETEAMQLDITDQIRAALTQYEDVARNMYLEAIPKQKRMIMEAPSVLVVAYKPKTKVENAKRVYDLNCLASVWCCIENFLLSLAEDNVFGVTFIPKNTNAVRAVLAIPDDFEIASIIPIGYISDTAKVLLQKEICLSAHIHQNRWGQSVKR